MKTYKKRKQKCENFGASFLYVYVMCLLKPGAFMRKKNFVPSVSVFIH